MKRTSAAILLLAGLGGGCVSTSDKTNLAPEGARPFNKATLSSTVAKAKDAMPSVSGIRQASATGNEAPVVRADAVGTIDNMVAPAAGMVRVNGMANAAGCADGSCGTPSYGGGGGGGGGNGLPAYGPTGSPFRSIIGHGAGILPVPAMGPAGAVAAVGAYGPNSGMYPGMYMGGRTQIRFVNPAGMKVTWQSGGAFADAGLEAPARYNFGQMAMYRLRLTSIPNRPGKNYYPTLEVYPATAKTVTFLSHSAVPVAFTDEDFDQVNAGNLVVKVIYLPDERFQDIAAVAGVDEVVSTRLQPGENPIEEANRRGTILAVIRIGNGDLQDPNTPPLDAPVMGMGGPPMGAPMARPTTMAPPAAMPPMPTGPTAPVSVPGMMPGTLPSAIKSPAVTGRPVSLPR